MPLHTVPLPHRSDSEPNLDELEFESKAGRSTATGRFKRKHDNLVDDVKLDEIKLSIDELKKMLLSTNSKQDVRHKCLLADVKDIKEQNADLRKSFEFMSKKYDDMKEKLDSMEAERKNNFLHIKKLEEKVEFLERSCKSCSLELRNVPQTKPETKEDLVTIVRNVGKALNMSIDASEIKDVFRTRSKQAIQPIVVELTTVIKKEKTLNSLKSLKKDQKGNQLTSTMISVGGPVVPIYVSDNLTTKARRIFSLAREFARNNSYKYCWSSHGLVYLRKTDGAPALRMLEEEDLDNLKISSK